MIDYFSETPTPAKEIVESDRQHAEDAAKSRIFNTKISKLLKGHVLAPYKSLSALLRFSASFREALIGAESIVVKRVYS